MTEPLYVDVARLMTAAFGLQELAFPLLPPSIVATGADPLSAAINESVPVMEAPVVEGIPAVSAALHKTGVNIATAADLYAESDERLGYRVDDPQFRASEPSDNRTESQPFSRGVVGQPGRFGGDSTTPGEPGPASNPDPAPTTPPAPVNAPTPGQFTAPAGFAGNVVQGVQSVSESIKGSVDGMSGASTLPGQPASDSASDQTVRVDDGRKSDDENADAVADGAAPGSAPREVGPIPLAGEEPKTGVSDVAL